MNQVSESATASHSNSKVAIFATARNCAQSVVNDVTKLQSAFASFKNLYWFVVESDSSDDTVARLQDLRQSVANFEYVSLGVLEPSYPLRTERIAFCRNHYLNEFRTNPRLSDAEYIVVADLDGVQDLITAEGVMSCFQRQDWGVCSANQQGLYYDIWALRHPVWSPNDCWQQKYMLQDLGLSQEQAAYAAVFSRMIEISRQSGWIEVDSSFGGLAIYKSDALGAATYNGRADNNLWGGQVCEHVAFHMALKARGVRLFINPQMINTALNEHSLQSQLPEELVMFLGDTKSDKAKDSPDSTQSEQSSSLAMSKEDIVAAYKVFLGRLPESIEVILPRVGVSANALLIDFLTSNEFLSRKGIAKLLNVAKSKLQSLDENKPNSNA